MFMKSHLDLSRSSKPTGIRGKALFKAPTDKNSLVHHRYCSFVLPFKQAKVWYKKFGSCDKAVVATSDDSVTSHGRTFNVPYNETPVQCRFVFFR